MSSIRSWARSPLGTLVVAAAVLVASCDGTPAEPPAPAEPQLTVDASAGRAFVTLGSTATRVGVADAAGSTAWDLAFDATSVMLNGGAAGPAGVVGHCVCQNAGATNAQLKAMTPQSELAKFEAVTAAQIPADERAWRSDSLAAAIAGWYRYDPTTHVVSAAASRVWKVRTASGASYAELRVASMTGASRENAGGVTLEFAVQDARGAPMGQTRTLVVDVAANTRVYVDLASGAVSDASKWDLALEGYSIRVNGGVSGGGRAGAVLVEEPFARIADASDLTDSHYRADGYGGVFEANRWYRYNLDGNHQVWPTSDVYLVRRGADVYKVQIMGYYGPAGESRHITFRYARLAG